MAADRIVTLSIDPDVTPADAGRGWWPGVPARGAAASAAAAHAPLVAAVPSARVPGASRADTTRDHRRLVDAVATKPLPGVAAKVGKKGWF